MIGHHFFHFSSKALKSGNNSLNTTMIWGATIHIADIIILLKISNAPCGVLDNSSKL